MPVFRLNSGSHEFPDPELADGSGLLAVGGDLSVGRLVRAYRSGIFPWYDPGETIHWWCPRTRFVIFPEEIHVSRSLKKTLKAGRYEIVFNRDFAGVIAGCRAMREGNTWLGDEMEAAYTELFRNGLAMCAEARAGDGLAGGLYGVSIGKCFFGESMFSKAPDASKAALVGLCRMLADEGYVFVDCQFRTPHLEKMGGRHISWEAYISLLENGLAARAR